MKIYCRKCKHFHWPAKTCYFCRAMEIIDAQKEEAEKTDAACRILGRPGWEIYSYWRREGAQMAHCMARQIWRRR